MKMPNRKISALFILCCMVNKVKCKINQNKNFKNYFSIGF